MDLCGKPPVVEKAVEKNARPNRRHEPLLV
jgi:hypothetical protein